MQIWGAWDGMNQLWRFEKGACSLIDRKIEVGAITDLSSSLTKSELNVLPSSEV